jgi:hypothetical protein
MTTAAQDKKTWNTVVEMLRLFTPVLLALLSYLFIGFQNVLLDNTKAITALQIQMARITEQLDHLKKTDTDFERRLQRVEDVAVSTSGRVSVIEEKLKIRK